MTNEKYTNSAGKIKIDDKGVGHTHTNMAQNMATEERKREDQTEKKTHIALISPLVYSFPSVAPSLSLSSLSFIPCQLSFPFGASPKSTQKARTFNPYRNPAKFSVNRVKDS